MPYCAVGRCQNQEKEIFWGAWSGDESALTTMKQLALNIECNETLVDLQANPY